VTDIPIEQMAVRRDVVEGVRALLDTFGAESQPGRSPGRLTDAIQKLQEGPPGYTTYLMLAFASATIRLAAHETGMDEIKILEELAKGFGVT
jgi:hypothetical protein